MTAIPSTERPVATPAAPPSATTPGQTTVPSPWQVAAALSRVETRRIVRSPATIAGIALTSICVFATFVDGFIDADEWLDLLSRHFPLFLYPLCGMVLLAVNRAALRSRRDGTEELFDALPATRATRSAALVLALRGPLLIGTVAVVALAGAAWWGNGNDAGWFERAPNPAPFTDLEPAPMLTAVVLVGCAGALGLLLARVVPWGLAPIVALVVLAVLTGVLNGATRSTPVAALSPFLAAPELPGRFAPQPLWPHLVYVTGLGVLAVGLTLLVDGERRWARPWLVTAAVLAGGGIVWQSLPVPDGTTERIARLASSPADERCEERDGITYCAYAGSERWIDEWDAVVSRVRAAVPAPGAGDPEVLQVFSLESIGELEPAVAARTSTDFATSGSAEAVYPSLMWAGGESIEYLGLLTGQWAVGLPGVAGADGEPCSAGGQARAVIAVYLAAASDPGRTAAYVEAHVRPDDIIQYRDYGDERYTDLLPTEWVSDQDAAVVYDDADLALALLLLERPRPDVDAVLADGWDRLVDPATASAELADELGLTVGDAGPGPEGSSPCP